MTLKKQYYAIAGIMIALSLFLGGFTIVHAEGEETTETVEVTTTDEKENSTTIDETKQIVEEISTKIDKVDNEIASQKVDSQKIEQQAIDIADLKEQLGEVKTSLAKYDEIPSYSNQYTNIPYDVGAIIPLRTYKPYYIYKLTVGGSSATGANRTYIFASNSPDLNIGWSYNNPGHTQMRIALKNIYTEDNGRLKQPICGCAVNSSFTEEQAKQLVTNPYNWGYTTLTENPTIPEGSVTINWGYQLCNSKNGEWALKDGPTAILTPYGEEYISDEQTGPEYYTSLGWQVSSTGGFYPLYEYTATGDSNDIVATLEILETVQPYTQEWTTEQLYMPVLVIMSILVIILFKKH